MSKELSEMTLEELWELFPIFLVAHRETWKDDYEEIKADEYDYTGVIMSKVRITIVSSKCRCGYCKAGDEFVVEDLCPPMCHELWHVIYPMVYALLNGASLDHGAERAKCFDAKCPDEGRVVVHAEVIG